jgi:hypothetical protein
LAWGLRGFCHSLAKGRARGCVAGATAGFEVGSRPDSRDTFFCSAKRKYPKKRRPGSRLLPALRSFWRGWRKGLPAPSPTCGIPAAPLRAIPTKTFGARRGIRDKNNPAIKTYLVDPISAAYRMYVIYRHSQQRCRNNSISGQYIILI